MKKRLLALPRDHSFFLFGARGTGKSTLIKNFYIKNKTWYIDLLDLHQESKYLNDPQLFKAEVLALPDKMKWIVIDEVQKIPALLNVVHALIEETDKKFILTGSSARQLKRGHANLLAGRAFVRNLYPFSFLELGDTFDLDAALCFGMLPKLSECHHDNDKVDFLRAYAHLYLKEEVWAEHLIRKLEPFQYFLEVAAQANGCIVNAANIAKDVGVDDKSVIQYFSILEDTLLGFYLPAFQHSFRKRLSHKPKFYFIDLGIARALSRTLETPITSRTYEYGQLFEHFVILECYKLSRYFFPDYRFSYLRTHDDLEIDLVIERPGSPILMIEIKSTDVVRADHVAALQKIASELGDRVEAICLAQVPRALKFDHVTVYPWQTGIQKFFLKHHHNANFA